MKFKDLLYAFTCLSFATVIGAAVYEHLAVVPRWTMAPPVSLSMFQGEYGLDAAAFWKPIHPVTLVLFVATLVTFWKSDRRKAILTAFAGYFTVLVITFAFFVPELIAITTAPFAQVADPDLTQRAQMWETLSLVRLAFLVLLSIALFLGLTKNGDHNASY